MQQVDSKIYMEMKRIGNNKGTEEGGGSDYSCVDGGGIRT